MKLNGKVSFVTGGSRGIGKAIVKKLAFEGSRVFFTYINDKISAEKYCKNLNGKELDVSFFQMDVTDRHSVDNVYKELSSKVDKLDILVNNAGINNPEDFDRISDDDWDSVVNVNLKGPFIVTQVLLPLLKKHQSSIINIGSVSGQYGGPRTAHYAASKAGLISLGQVIARYGAKYNIRCNTISAGLINSDMADAGMNSKLVKKASKNILLNRFGEMSEIADAVAFLASEESQYITAKTINVNGGLYF